MLNTRFSARDRALVVLARYPEAGVVKTRLGATLGAAEAAEIYRAFLADIGRRLGDDPRWKFHWSYSPADSRFPTEIADGRAGFPQPEGDLGERMAGAIGRLFAEGYREVVLIGSDVPQLSAERIASGFEQLESGAAVVIGPAEDGGYYLIGARERVPPLFSEIAWGTATVLAATLAAAKRAALDVRLLETDYDVDTVTDLERLRRDIEDGRSADLAATRRALDDCLASDIGRRVLDGRRG